MFKLWIEQNLLSKQDIQTMERRIKEFDVGTGLGRNSKCYFVIFIIILCTVYVIGTLAAM